MADYLLWSVIIGAFVGMGLLKHPGGLLVGAVLGPLLGLALASVLLIIFVVGSLLFAIFSGVAAL